MSEKKRILLLVFIMAVACVSATGTTILVLYQTAFEEQRDILVSIVQNHARLIRDMAGLNNGPTTVLSQVTEDILLEKIIGAHKHFERIGHTGEFALAKREGSDMVFLLDNLNKIMDEPTIISMKSKLAEPMRRALLGQSGSMVGLDYRGTTVLAAYEAIPALNWGIVAKVDIDELRVPYARAGALAMAITVIVVLVGTLFFLRITNPIIAQLREHSRYLAELVESLKKSEESLREARDELEIRVKERTAKLVQANDQLGEEIKVRSRAEDRLRALWMIARMVNADERELCDHILQGTLQMTQSKYAFYGFLNRQETVMTIYSWSREALAECGIMDKPIEYPVADAGIWAEAIRQRRVVVVNDYRADNPGKRGLPDGHVQITRILAVPVYGLNQIVAVVVAANKISNYDDEDIKQLEAFSSGVQLIIDQRRMEDALRKSEKECRLLSYQVLDAQEKERKRVAREIHDGIGQSLAALKYRAESQIRTSARGNPKSGQELHSLVQMIRDTMEEVRRIQNDLRPAYLDMMGVLETMSDFCGKFQATYPDIETSMQIGVAEDDVPEPLKVPLFRIFQEAINNAARHSGAKRILISVQRDEEKLVLEVGDDGRGFELADGLESDGRGGGLGLFSMRDRAELSGGFLEIKTAPGEGTTVIGTWIVASKSS